MKECFITKNFEPKKLALIEQINAIIAEYEGLGKMSVRQIAYQLISRDLLPSTTKSHVNTLVACREGRKAGLVDWDMIEDRSRERVNWLSYDDPADAIKHTVEIYREDPWRAQPYRPEVWFEKDAVSGIIEPACREFHVPYLPTHGDLSDTLVYEAAKRFVEYINQGLKPIILYLGDHDPKGINMPRNLRKRLACFMGFDPPDAASGEPITWKDWLTKPKYAQLEFPADPRIEVRRLGLNMDQVRRYRPPPNKAKEKDKLRPRYIKEFGTHDCWELDALRPDVIVELIRTALDTLIDREKWDKAEKAEARNKRELTKVADELAKKVR